MLLVENIDLKKCVFVCVCVYVSVYMCLCVCCLCVVCANVWMCVYDVYYTLTSLWSWWWCCVCVFVCVVKC